MKTFSEILYQHIGHNLYFDLSKEQLSAIYDAMQEAINQDRKIVERFAKNNFNTIKTTLQNETRIN